MTGFLKVNGERITNAGLIVRVDRETKTRAFGTVVDVFIPVHRKPHGDFQIAGERAKFLRKLLVGQERCFWTSGTRWGHSVGGNEFIVDWAFQPTT